MPNGGPDCCGECGINKAVQEMGQQPVQMERFTALSHCNLRDVKISNPFWTYCQNFQYGKILPDHDEKTESKGWIFAAGLYEGYVRIPWHGKVEPEVSTPCECTVCKRQTDNGIKVFHEGIEVGFCTNRHYIDWWKTKHDDLEINSDGFLPPEEIYKD